MTSSTSRPAMAARQTSSWLARKAGKPKVRASRSLRAASCPAAVGKLFAKQRWPGRLGHGVDPSSHSARGGEAVPGTRPRLGGVDGCGVGLRGVRLDGARRASGRRGLRRSSERGERNQGPRMRLQRQQTDDQCEGEAEGRREEVAHALTPPNGERLLLLPATERTVKVHQFRDLEKLGSLFLILKRSCRCCVNFSGRRRKKSRKFSLT